MTWSLFFVLQELDAQIESLRDELQLAHTLSDGKNRHLDDDSAAARRDAATIQATLEAREAARAETAHRLPAPFLRQYERLRAGHTIRPWVIGFAGGHCPACNLALPSALVSKARRTREPATCHHCQRLLIWRDPSPSRPGGPGPGPSKGDR